MRLYLLIGAGIILVALFAIAIIVHQKNKFPPNYRAFFIIGVTWVPLGIILGNTIFTGVGAAMLLMGLINRKKWRVQPPWNELPVEIRRLKLSIIIILTILLIAGIVVMLQLQNG